MRRPNGYGGIVKLSGKRRKPFQVRITTGWENTLTEDGEIKAKQKFHILGSYPTYQDANLALAIYNNDPYDIALKGITFAEAFPLAIEKRMPLADNTLKGYYSAYNKVQKIHKKQLLKLKKNELQAIVNSAKTVPTQKQIINIFNIVFGWAENEINLIKENPCKHLGITAGKEEKREGQPYTVDEIKRLWYHVHRNDIPGGIFLDTILAQIYTGTRITELLTLKKEDTFLDERYVIVRGTKNENAVRIVPLRKEIIPLLRARMNDQKNKTDYVFVSIKGGPFQDSRHYSDACFCKVRSSLAMETHVTHDARHTFISRADDSGINENALKKIVGHSLSGVTGKSYTHKDAATLIQEVDKIRFI